MREILPRITVEGRIVAEPDLRFAPSGVAVCNFRLVSSDRKKDEASGEWVDTKTLWLRVTSFKKLAENCAESLEKGDLVTVVGKISTNEWEDNDGIKRSTTELIADSVAASLQFRTIPHGAGKAQRASAPAEGPDPWAVSTDDAPPF